MGRLVKRYVRWRRQLNLDDRRMLRRELFVNAPETGSATPPRMAVLFLQRVMSALLKERCVAMNLFFDAEDNSLRGLGYRAAIDVGPSSGEIAPAPGCFAQQVLRELRWRAGIVEIPGQGTLQYRRGGKALTALAEAPNASEVRVYFTADRPVMRTKGIAEELVSGKRDWY